MNKILLAAIAFLPLALSAETPAERPLLQKISFVQKPGPAAKPPATPPNLPKSAIDRFIEAAEQVDKRAVDAISPEDWQRATDVALKALMSELKIPHSTFHTAKEFEDLRKSMANASFGGVGMTVSKEGKDKPAVLSPIPGSPSELAGVKEDDVLTHVDGVEVKDLDLEAIVTKIRGPKGTTVALRIERKGKPLTPDISVVRGDVKIRESFAKMIPGTDIGYVHFSHFGDLGVTDVAVFKHIETLINRGAKKLIIDVRFNPGGAVSTVGEICSQFLKDGQPIVNFKRQGQVESYGTAKDDNKYKSLPLKTIPLVVMVNGYSASASEILAGDFQDLKRATIVGSRSYGKGSAQAIIPIITDVASALAPSAVRITSSKWFTPNDRSIQAKIDPKTGSEIKGTGGIVPDVVVARTEDEDKALAKSLNAQIYGRPTSTPDPQLDKAVEILKALP